MDYIAAYNRAATEADKHVITRYGRVRFEDEKIMQEWLDKFEGVYARVEPIVEMTANATG